jgi:hypothetical protein
LPAVDFAVTHDVAMSDQPVFFVTIKPGNIHSEPARLAADAQMRHIMPFRNYNDTSIPILHSISVMGQKFAFYSMTKATNDILYYFELLFGHRSQQVFEEKTSLICHRSQR